MTSNEILMHAPGQWVLKECLTEKTLEISINTTMAAHLLR